VASAVTLIAAIGDISRFEDPRKLVGYLGLDPKVRQSGDAPARGAKISKRGNTQARSVLVEAAWSAMRTPGPLRAFGARVQARSGGQVAAVAVARKICVLAWHLLSRGEDYAFARPSLVRQKIRSLERDAEHQLAEHAETAYQRITADWAASRPIKAGAGATQGRASTRPSTRQAARQAQAPRPAL